LSIGTPSAISANSRLGVPEAMSGSVRRPGNRFRSQNSVHDFGSLPGATALVL
jgi:hypothetical protein